MKIGRQGGMPVNLKRALTMSEKVGWIIRIAILVVFLVWLVWAQNNWIVKKNYIYTDIKVPKTFVGYTITHVTDLHNSGIGVVSAVKKSNPDLILVTGGLVDDKGRYNNSVKMINQFANIAPTYYVLGDNDSQYTNEINQSIQGAYNIEDAATIISAPEVDTQKFLDKYIGSRILNKAKKEADLPDEEKSSESVYVDYTIATLAEDADAYFILSGLAYEEQKSTIIERIYNNIGTDKEIFQLCIASRPAMFSTISTADLDLVLSGETHGTKGITEGYSKGVYTNSGTTLFLSGGIGNLDSYPSRVFNFPEISVIKLSDGTIKKENPLEKLLAYFIGDVSTRFDDDEGFKEHRYTYKNEYTLEGTVGY